MGGVCHLARRLPAPFIACVVLCSSGSTAIAVSQLPNQAPVVVLTAPLIGATYLAPATITVSATASDIDGMVTVVEFYAGAMLIGSDASSPYSVTWTNVPAGTYSLTAVARDNAGAATTSLARSVTVTAVPNQAPTVSLTAPADGATFTAPATMTVGDDDAGVAP